MSRTLDGERPIDRGEIYKENRMSAPYEGLSATQHVAGVTGTNTAGGEGVHGESESGTGVVGKSKTWAGVLGESETSTGVVGKSKGWAGVYGESETKSAVWGHSKEWIGVLGESESQTTGAGVYGKGRTAGFFEGDVVVTTNLEVKGDVRLPNADCAEQFDVCRPEDSEPGTVMVLHDDGRLQPSQHAYDKRVAGVVSGAGEYRPAMILDVTESQACRRPIALVGKVFCKADAHYGPIAVGDLLTTSPTPGHAMKAVDPAKAFGAVIGKALRPLREGEDLIPILVALQ